MKNLCIYHKSCADGFGAALAVKMYFDSLDEECEFLSANYGDEAPDVVGMNVVIVDFSYPRDVLIRMDVQSEHIIVLDHHKTAEDNLKGLDFCIFDMTRSGAMMAWQYFHKQSTVPSLIQYIQDRDLWKWELTNSKEVSSGLQLLPFDFDLWQQYLSDYSIGELVEHGSVILNYQKQQVKNTLNHEVEMGSIAGHIVPCINCTHLISEVGNDLSKGHPFAAMYFETHDKRVYSLSSASDGVDVSAIAKQYGGGGHFHAAGFSVDKTKINI